MYRVKNLSKCINRINHNNRNSLNSNYLQSNTRLINNNNNNNSLSTIQQYQKRDISFFTNVYNNFIHLIESNPDHMKLMEDFDRVFLNSRFKKQKEKEEQEKKDFEAKMEAYSKSAEERAKEEANLSPEEIQKRREEEQKLYEELINEKAKKTKDRQRGRPMPSGDVKLQTETGSEAEQTEALKKLKAIYDKANGIRPIPFEPDREEPTFENCQNFIGTGEFGLYELDPNDMLVNTNPDVDYFGLDEQFELSMNCYEDVGKFLLETDLEARKLGIQYNDIDWESFIYTEEDVASLPKPYLEFLHRKLDMQYGEKIKQAEKEEEEKELKKEEHLKELHFQEDGNGRNLNAPDNPKHYPVLLENPEIEPVAKDPLLIRIYDKVLDVITPPEKYATSYLYDFLVYNFYKGSPTNNMIINQWEKFAPGTTLDKLLIELRTDFLPNYFYHYFHGNIRELEQYTHESQMEDITKQINNLEGTYKIANHEVLGVSKINFCKFMIVEEGSLLKVTIRVLHKMGLRDYNGDPIVLSREERNSIYISHFRFYLSLDTLKNRFGWVATRIQASYPHKVLNLIPEDQIEEYKILGGRTRRGKKVKETKSIEGENSNNGENNKNENDNNNNSNNNKNNSNNNTTNNNTKSSKSKQ